MIVDDVVEVDFVVISCVVVSDVSSVLAIEVVCIVVVIFKVD